MTAGQRDIGATAGAILRAGVDLPLREVSPAGCTLDGPGTLEVRVGISGAWSGEAVIRCAVGLARRVAGQVYGVPPQQARVDQIQNAITELAWLLAAGLEPALPQPCTLALPRVRAGCDADVQRLTGPVRREARFECEGESLAVLLVERLPAA